MARAPSTAGASPALHGQRRIAGGKLSIAFAVSVRLAARRRSGAPITGSTAPRPFSCIISTPQLARRKRLASNGNGGNVELTDCHRHPARPPPGGHRPADGAALHRGMVAARGPGLQPHRRWRRRRVVGCDPVRPGRCPQVVGADHCAQFVHQGRHGVVQGLSDPQRLRPFCTNSTSSTC